MLARSVSAAYATTPLLLCASIVAAQEAFGADVSASWLDFSSLLKELNRDQRLGVFVTVAVGLAVGFVLGRLRRYGWDLGKAWAGKPKFQKTKRPRPGIERVSDSDDEEVDPASIRGTPEYQRRIRGKAITLLVLLISAYYMHNFINQKCGRLALPLCTPQNS